MEPTAAELAARQDPNTPLAEHTPEPQTQTASEAKNTGNQSTEAQSTRPKVKEYEISATGGNREVSVDAETRLTVIPLMQRQRQEAQRKASAGERLTNLENHLLNSSVLSNIESGAIGKAEMVTIYSALTIELSQIDTSTQYSATEIVPERTWGQRLRRQQPEPQITITQTTENPKISTDSIRRRGLNNLEDPEAIQNYTRELAQATVDLQTSLFGREIGDPIIDRFTGSQFEYGLATSGNNFHNATREKVTQLLEQKYNGTDYSTLQKEDPVAAAAIWLEAQQQALPEFTESFVRETLNLPNIDVNNIDHHIDTIKKPPTPEDLKNDEEIVKTAKGEHEKAEEEYNALDKKLQTLNSQIETLQTEFESADEEYQAAEETFTLSKSYWEDIINDNDRHITTFATAINAPIPPGATAQQVQAIKKSNEALSTQINAAEVRKTEARKKLAELQEAVAKAKAKKDIRETKLRTLKAERDTIEDPANPTGGQLELKRVEKTAKETDWKNKDKDLTEKKNSQS
ncbi:MAG TPA: hypothetical protein PLD54_01200, partial [Candidatus Levybacteria bacterium]|nr:hypothetical protein [Candidatus Levybacteria bacterium]